jgi:hypothetical protein
MRVPPFLVQERGEFFGLSNLRAAVPNGQLSIFVGWNEAQRGVRSTLVMVPPPIFDLAFGVVKRKEPIGIQTSSRNRPLKDSNSALSVGFPGRLKSSVT